jgi:glycosyltransferase involved in cell wall biosynthesis
MVQLCICATIKNEANYIYEWLSYHYMIGVRRFILYDNASTDDTRAVIRQWPRSDLVTLVDWPMAGGQVPAYADMLQRFRDAGEWCAFIDCDEFLCPQTNLSVGQILAQLGHDVDGLYVNWWMFGSSGHLRRQPGLVTETFRMRMPDDAPSHHYGKSIMRLSKVTEPTIHMFRADGKIVNDEGWELEKSSIDYQARKSHTLIALNHYFTKSREEWIARRSIGKGDRVEGDSDFRRSDHEFDQHDINVVHDERAAHIIRDARALFYGRDANAL